MLRLNREQRRQLTAIEVECMPIVQVSVWEGITLENKKKTVEGTTKVFENLDVPKEAIHIVIYEAPKNN